MHGTVNIARTAVGIVGNVISFAMFLAPVPTFHRIYKKKTTEEFHPYPYLATSMNCMFWIFYGLPFVHPDSTLVITINGVGLLLEAIYLTIFLIYTTNKNRRIIVCFLVGEVALLGGVAAITLLTAHTHTVRSLIVGVICVVFGVVMYASPLSIIRKVIKTKSAEFLPLWLCLAGFLNGVTWFAYAFLKKFDPYLAVGNGTGALLGFIQLVVYTYYTWIAKKSGAVQDDANLGDVQLEKHNAASLPPV